MKKIGAETRLRNLTRGLHMLNTEIEHIAALLEQPPEKIIASLKCELERLKKLRLEVQTKLRDVEDTDAPNNGAQHDV